MPGNAEKRPSYARVTRPPTYVNIPTQVAYVSIPDALIVTMMRVLGLCWTHRHRHSSNSCNSWQGEGLPATALTSVYCLLTPAYCIPGIVSQKKVGIGIGTRPHPRNKPWCPGVLTGEARNRRASRSAHERRTIGGRGL